MSNWIWKLVIGIICAAGFYIILLVIMLVLEDTKTVAIEERKKYEIAYFEGQRDALSKDVRIKKLDNRTFVWIKSPHNDSTPPAKDTIYSFANYK